MEEESFFDQNPDVEDVEAFIVDVNGVLRGKSMPRGNAGKVFNPGIRLPRSVFAVDIWGRDVLAARLVAETGDNDGICRAVPGTLHKVSWANRPMAQVMLTMADSSGKPFFADPRQVLAKVLSLYKKAGLTPVVAAELEFYLLDARPDEKGRPQPPLSPVTGKRSEAEQILGMKKMAEFDGVLSEIAQCCRAQGIPADAASSENGPGQFEINLYHVPDALKAADHATLMKRVVSGVASKHGMAASFMAKPYGDKSGNGLHIHFSILDNKGRNIFAGKDSKGSPQLKHALGGLLKVMSDSIAVLAPNANSYRRFRAGSHAPTKITWGYDNRSASLRVPDSDLAATRIEYRVPGADTNPYLALAVILGGAFYGLKGKIKPPLPVKGNAYASKAKCFPSTWDEALEAFAQSRFIDDFIGKDYKKLYLACKRQEQEEIGRQVSSVEHDAYLGL
jgi:glutamine synthetase